jgi:spore germination protein GerM
MKIRLTAAKWTTGTVLGAVLAALLAACGNGTSSQPASTSTSTSVTTSTSAQETAVSLYFMRADTLGVADRQVPVTSTPEVAAMKALLGGPNATERAAGLATNIPTGTVLLGLSINNGVALANMNKTFESGGGSLSMMSRLAQVVYTLTQFGTVHNVTFQLDGTTVTTFGGEGLILTNPLGRLDGTLTSVLPNILLETPAVGDHVHSPLHVSGISNTFEATYNVELIDSTGKVVLSTYGTASAGTGTWGTFDASFPYKTTASGIGQLKVYSVSAKDGSHINEVDLSLPVDP